ncbi:hypothetical protein RB595_000363 [Gaeumannomyces hyphopodioides]
MPRLKVGGLKRPHRYHARGGPAYKPYKSPTPLLTAIRGKLSILRAVLKGGRADIEKKDGYSRTPLHYAVIKGRVEAVKLLLARKASVSAKTDDSFTPLTFAAMYGKLKIFNLLLENGASVSTLCSEARTPLHYAAKYGHIEIANILLEKGVSPQAQDKGRGTALDYAVYKRHWDMVELLLKKGRRGCWSLSQSQPQENNKPPAASVNDEAVISALKKETGPSRQTPLEVAAFLGRNDLVHRLVNEHGCHPQGIRWREATPLYLAVENGHQGCIEMLVSCGADVNEHGCHPQGTGRQKATPLYLAVENGHQGFVEMLVSCGADVNHRSSGWMNPLQCALQLRHDDIAGILLDAGAYPHFQPPVGDSENPIVALLAMREPNVAAQLLSHVPSLNTLSIWLVEMAGFKQVGILQKYIRTVVPIVRNKYANQPVPTPTAKLVQLLLQSGGTLATAPTAVNKARALTEASASHNLDVQRTILAALHSRFVNVFFLLSIVDPGILSEVLASVPTVLEEAERLLPWRVDRYTDSDLVTCLSTAGYTLTTPPRDAPGPPAPPALSPAQQIFYDICEAGSTAEVRRRLQVGGEDVNAVGLRDRTPLHAAAQRGHLEIVKLLVDHGADVTATTFFGSTAEALAEKFDWPAVAAFLKAAREAVEGVRTAGSSASPQEQRVEQDQPRE